MQRIKELENRLNNEPSEPSQAVSSSNNAHSPHDQHENQSNDTIDEARETSDEESTVDGRAAKVFRDQYASGIGYFGNAVHLPSLCCLTPIT